MPEKNSGSEDEDVLQFLTVGLPKNETETKLPIPVSYNYTVCIITISSLFVIYHNLL